MVTFSSAILQIIFFFFFNDTATTEIYTLSLHDALPISRWPARTALASVPPQVSSTSSRWAAIARRSTCWEVTPRVRRSEEHTSELQSQSNLVCRLLLEKKKNADELSFIV